MDKEELYSIEDLFSAWALGFEYADKILKDEELNGRFLKSASLRRRFHNNLELILKNQNKIK
jgi:hypothetical protein